MPAPYAMPLHRFCQAFHTVHLCAMTLGTLSLKLPWQMMLETLQSQQSYPSETRLSNMVCFSPTDRALNLLASQNANRSASKSTLLIPCKSSVKSQCLNLLVNSQRNSYMR